MNKNVIIGLVVVLIVLGGGFFYYQSTQSNPAQTTTTEQTTNETTKQSETAVSPAQEASESADSDTDGTVKEFTVENKGMTFVPNQLTVNKGDTVRITFKNTGGFHDWVLDEFNAKTKQLPAGEEETIEFVADQAGDFEFYCSVGNHRQMGMKGTLTVK